ncbi:MAG: cytochrome c oxidase subunit 3 [Flavobacteriales bacterium]|nr:cytochrome c oxidase subunit 3 [Flavobacteriales bacterium]
MMKDVVKRSMPKKEYQKVAKQIVWVGIIASIMLYAGFTSAVFVSMMDKFWVDIKLPEAFTLSTIVIIASSITLFLALFFAKKDNKKAVVALVGVTFVLGIVFSVSQFKGWGQLVADGNYIADKIFFDYGSYGNQYTILKNGKEITHDGYAYFLEGEELSTAEVNELKNFSYQICKEELAVRDVPYRIENYGNPYTVQNIAQGKTVEFREGKAFLGGDSLTFSQRNELFKFSFGVYHDMPFFMLKGKYGEDFSINLNGEKLDFENRKLYFPERTLTADEIKRIKKSVFQGGKEYVISKGKVYLDDQEVDLANFETYIDLNKGIQVHLKNGEWTQLRQELNTIQYGEFYQTGNVASSYVWILTIIHFLHLIVGLIVILALFIRAIKGIYNKENQLGLVVGGIFWHFLGALWVYLFVFLQYIH